MGAATAAAGSLVTIAESGDTTKGPLFWVVLAVGAVLIVAIVAAFVYSEIREARLRRNLKPGEVILYD